MKKQTKVTKAKAIRSASGTLPRRRKSRAKSERGPGRPPIYPRVVGSESARGGKTKSYYLSHDLAGIYEALAKSPLAVEQKITESAVIVEALEFAKAEMMRRYAVAVTG